MGMPHTPPPWWTTRQLLILQLLTRRPTRSIPRKHKHRDVNQEDNGRDDGIGDIRGLRGRELPPESPVDDTEDDHGSAEPTMGHTEDTPTTCPVVVEMLVETHGGLKEDEREGHDEANDHVWFVELVDLLAEFDSKHQTDD